MRRHEEALAAGALRDLEVHVVRPLDGVAVEAEPAEAADGDVERPGDVGRRREHRQAALGERLDVRAPVGEPPETPRPR